MVAEALVLNRRHAICKHHGDLTVTRPVSYGNITQCTYLTTVNILTILDRGRMIDYPLASYTGSSPHNGITEWTCRDPIQNVNKNSRLMISLGNLFKQTELSWIIA